MNKHRIAIVAAVGLNGEIGQNNALPWRGQVPGELKWFKELTTQHFANNTIVYGRKTFESLGSKPLPGRDNIVISNTLQQPSPVSVCGYEVRRSLKEPCLEAQRNDDSKVWIIGGAQIFREALPFVEEMWLSHIPGEFNGADAFFPFLSPMVWAPVETRAFENFTAVKYWRKA